MHDTLTRRFELEWVADVLADSIRQAGFTPCLRLDKTKVVDRRTEHAAAVVPLQILSSPYPVIQVNRMSTDFSKVLSIKNQQQVLVSKSSQIIQGHPILIADCTHAEIHEPLHIQQTLDGTLVTLARPLSVHYSNAYLGRWLEEQWFVRPNAQGVLSLHYKLRHTEELSALIHHLQARQLNNMLDIHLGVGTSTPYHLRVRLRCV